MRFLDNARRRGGSGLLIGGHRGHLAAVRENTIANFELLRKEMISHIEVDVQLTADGEAVIYHDIDLAAQSPLTGRVGEHTLAELRGAFDINTLDEVLEWCSDNDMPAALEIKSEPLSMYAAMPCLSERIADALRRHCFFDMSFVFSTDWRSLCEIKRLAPETELGLIVPVVPADPLSLMRKMEAQVYLTFLENLEPGLVRALKGAGYTVDGSVVNDTARLLQALSLGVDLIESDVPARMLKAYRGDTK